MTLRDLFDYFEVAPAFLCEGSASRSGDFPGPAYGFERGSIFGLGPAAILSVTADVRVEGDDVFAKRWIGD